MNQLLLIGLGGGIGAMLRYLVVSGVARLNLADFPYSIVLINILGSFLMGLLVSVGAQQLPLSAEVRTFLGVGLLGGFTTFSAFSLDVVTLMQRGETIPALIYMVSSVTLSVIALAVGISLWRVAS
ncbi:MAG: fluoride efflux transporter CrcB [Rickettsiales bacterium]|nr:fluoride efflux transporter CrcB [Rickettsiales bacterium]